MVTHDCSRVHILICIAACSLYVAYIISRQQDIAVQPAQLQLLQHCLVIAINHIIQVNHEPIHDEYI